MRKMTPPPQADRPAIRYAALGCLRQKPTRGCRISQNTGMGSWRNSAAAATQSSAFISGCLAARTEQPPDRSKADQGFDDQDASTDKPGDPGPGGHGAKQAPGRQRQARQQITRSPLPGQIGYDRHPFPPKERFGNLS